MKRLYLVRHAKSSWQESTLSDFDRPLNRRGERDAPQMAERLARRGVRPDRLLSSGAVRAITTARVLAEALKYPASAIEENNRIYEADAGDLLAIVRALDRQWDTVMVVGHNPAMTDLVNALTDEIVENVPTCGIMEIVFDGDDWAGIDIGGGHLAAFDFPRNGD
ncbi:MAG: histidine phosphatase family protein [Lentisphaerae bacterium]|nr:histidine phosphatase family protein [Lentisphaerota bacterium]